MSGSSLGGALESLGPGPVHHHRDQLAIRNHIGQPTGRGLALARLDVLLGHVTYLP
ncbi:hypothetical protein [Streptomyces himalayensis]|uniref:Uncharacterized protein n=1 Tax=Streptomyces himalayensis subsp. himalayensis TaxID=2756131 RepID=A0A7W0DHY4_9ACTN|nr:hypothetical protein [Streptomyces himalayensis]MBA2945461.1 hypothetical protein [Streptomyces himalayensis subsp. himalayensis]